MTAGRALPAAALALAGLLTAAALAGVLAAEGTALADGLAATPAIRLVAALAVYVAAHLVRVVRMIALLGDTGRSMRDVAAAHLLTAPIAAMLPLKTGELARIAAIGRASQGPVHGVRAVWVERTFDAAAIAVVGALVLALRPEAVAAVTPVVLAALAFLGVTAAAIVVLPESVGMAKAWLIRRYTATWSNRALRVMHHVRDALSAARGLLRGKVATLALLTAIVWGAEALALALLVPIAGSLPALAADVLGALSGALTPGAVALAAHRAVVVVGVLLIGLAGGIAEVVRGRRA